MAGFIRKHTGLDLTGNEAVRQAQRAQERAGKDAIASHERGLEQLRADLEPFTQFGTGLLPQLQAALDPNQQASSIMNNPLFQQLAQDTTNRVFSSQASRGRLGSSETANVLGSQLLPLGMQLQQQQISNLFNAVNLGQNSAAMQGQGAMQAKQFGADILQNIGNVQAAGIGQRQANTANILGQGLALGGNLLGSAGLAGLGGILSDKRFKKNIKKIGKLDNGLNVYSYQYKGDETYHLGVMAQEVEEVNPNAVIEHDGIKYVKYGEL